MTQESQVRNAPTASEGVVEAKAHWQSAQDVEDDVRQLQATYTAATLNVAQISRYPVASA